MDNKLYEEIGKAVEKSEKRKNADLTTKNLKYVVKVAMDMCKKTGVDFNELLVEGVIGMKKAEEKYDPEQNDSFTKYAAKSVRGYMLNAVNRQGNLVHIPANHLQGFKKGQEANEETKLSYERIDSFSYDSLGTVDNAAFDYDREHVLRMGLNRLDDVGRTIMKMKLRIDEYSNMEKNSFKTIAEELDLTIPVVNKIFKESLDKLSKYCQHEMNR